MANKTLILGSTSPFRRELLMRLGIDFSVSSPHIDETALPKESPKSLSMRLAALKARAVKEQNPEAVVIGSDQVCDFEGKAVGKPHCFEKAFAQLKAMSGKSAVFYTALCVIDQAGRETLDVCETKVTFRKLTDLAIENYLKKEEPYACAGSAKIESLGIALMEKVQSDDPTSLIGLPLMILTTRLIEAGISPIKGL